MKNSVWLGKTSKISRNITTHFKYQKYRGRVKRKEAPKQWNISRIIDKSNRDSGPLATRAHSHGLQARITYSNWENEIYIGSFDEEQEAARAVDEYLASIGYERRNFPEDEVEDLEDLGGDAVSSPQ
jgi:hypothetical protein